MVKSLAIQQSLIKDIEDIEKHEDKINSEWPHVNYRHQHNAKKLTFQAWNRAHILHKKQAKL